MRIQKIDFQRLAIPFRTSFKHASAERSETEAVIATATAHNGVTGYGEGCPRIYVTGETIESCFTFLHAHQQAIQAIDSVASLKAYVSQHAVLIDRNPSAWCAIETAILDLLGKLENSPIEAVLGLPHIEGSFSYTAVLGVAHTQVFQAQLAQYQKLGLSDFKVKVSGNPDTDRENLQHIYAGIPHARVRLDANNLWHNVAQAQTYLQTLGAQYWAIEEPIDVGNYAGLKELATCLSRKIILDESFLGAAQLANIVGDPDLWIPNLRISKMGGLLRSLALAEACQQRGIQLIVGAQVGETSILTRVALSLVNAFRGAVRAQEGAFGTYLLERDIVDTPIMFGAQGHLIFNTKNAAGLGLNWAA